MANLGLIPAKWAAVTPRLEAVIDASTGQRTTFARLDERVRRLANGLRGNGDGGLDLQHGDRVAVLTKNSTELVELYFAAGRAGLVASPLNWRLGVPELKRILEDSGPRALIVSDEFAATAQALLDDVDVEHWLQFGPASDGSYEELLARSSDEEPRWSTAVGDDDPWFMLYTGGTTGESKGALHSHRSALSGMWNQTVAERIVPSDVHMVTGQLFHIVCSLAFNYTRHGCPIVLTNFEAQKALEIIETERVSAFLGVTTMLNWMMAVPDFSSYDVSSLRNIQYGGGPMPTSVIKAALEAFPCTLDQVYGSTEAGTVCVLSQDDHVAALAGDHPERLRSCGREAIGTTVRVVDSDGRPVPQDGTTVGEIVVRSEGNLLRYWNRPELTAHALRDGWFWTGDLAAWDADRYVYVIDRAKDMIISGGENIYSVQVEEAINQHPAVLECAVIGAPDDEWGEAVKAIVVLKPDATATEAEIIATAREHLASYQKPRSVDFVDALPKAPTGKILKRELRAPLWAERERSV